MIDTSQWPFDTVLVANRGEIAARILRTVKALGLKGVVVYHRADRNTPALALADVAVEITGDTPVAAYLDAQQILAAARSTGAGATRAMASCPRMPLSVRPSRKPAWRSSARRLSKST